VGIEGRATCLGSSEGGHVGGPKEGRRAGDVPRDESTRAEESRDGEKDRRTHGPRENYTSSVMSEGQQGHAGGWKTLGDWKLQGKGMHAGRAKIPPFGGEAEKGYVWGG